MPRSQEGCQGGRSEWKVILPYIESFEEARVEAGQAKVHRPGRSVAKRDDVGPNITRALDLGSQPGTEAESKDGKESAGEGFERRYDCACVGRCYVAQACECSMGADGLSWPSKRRGTCT